MPISLLHTRRAVLSEFVGVVATIILAIAVQPLRDASVIGMARTTFPADCAVLVSADVSWLVTVITTVIVKVTAPEDRDASTVGAGELGFRMAWSIICKVEGMLEM